MLFALLSLATFVAKADIAPSPKFDCPNIARLDGTLADEFFEALPVKAVEHVEGDTRVLIKEIKTERGTQLTCTQLRGKDGKTVDYFRGMKPNCIFRPALAAQIPGVKTH